jgi:rhamnose transport system substrate-binding protein
MLKRWMLLSLGCVLAIAGCHSEAPSSGGSTTAAGGGALKIVFIPKSSGNAYFKGIIQGFEDASKEIHADFTTMAPAQADATSQISIIKDQIQRGVDVIALAANSPDALNPVLDQARAKGITVITVDADITGNESHRDAAVEGTDFTTIGSSEVELLGSLINYSGPIAILSATTDAPNQNVWIAGMKEALKQPKYAKMTLVDTVYGDDDQQKSTTECQALLSKHPDLRGIISPTFVGVQAAAQTIQLAGVYPGGPHAVGGGIQLTGLCTPLQLKSYVQKGVVTSFQLWDLHDMGYIAVYLGKQIHDKTLKPAEGGEFTAGSVGKRPIGRLNVVVPGPLLTFNKSNIDKYNF